MVRAEAEALDAAERARYVGSLQGSHVVFSALEAMLRSCVRGNSTGRASGATYSPNAWARAVRRLLIEKLMVHLHTGLVQSMYALLQKERAS